MNTQNTIKTGCRNAVLCALVVFCVAGGSARADMHLRTYRVTLQNLTDGQALTPPLAATHAYGPNIFEVGESAIAELQAIAENGNNTPLRDLLLADSAVLDVAEGATGPLVPASNPGGTSFTDATDVIVTGDPTARFISMVAMLICTNDGFTGLNSFPLPLEGAKVILTSGYDAGTEMNTEDYTDLVPPCQELFGVTSGKTGAGESNPLLAENGVITYHAGIKGGADLTPDVSGWRNPVAKITITCIDADADRLVATLSGAGENPTVPSFATGWAAFEINDERRDVDYELHVEGISGVTQAHIHFGLPGVNAGVVAFLFGRVPPLGLVNGELSRGTITEADLVGALSGNWDGFVQALRDGQCYANVHTAEYPGGEIRGQIGARLSGPK